MTYAEYISSYLWRSLPARLAALERDEYRCVGCNTEENLTVHHRSYPTEWGQERIQDLYTLCVECHESITSIIRGRRYAGRTIPTEDVKQIRPGKESYQQEFVKRELSLEDVPPRTILKGVTERERNSGNVSAKDLQSYWHISTANAQRPPRKPPE